MRDLHYYITNPFADPGLGLDKLLAFTSDHLQRMISNNPGGVYALRITVTSAALTAVSNAFTDDQTKLGLRKARKLAKNTFRETLPKSVGKLAVAVEAKFGEGSPEFLECFPAGRTVFTTAADDKLVNHLQTLVNGVTNRQTQLGAQAVTDATALLTGWNAVFSPSEASTGAKTTTQAAKNAARAGLQLELFKNLLTIALNFPGVPEKLDLYMHQSLLEDQPAAPEPEPVPTT